MSETDEDVIAVGGALELAGANDLNAVLTHQSPDAALANLHTQFVQLLGHARPAVPSVAAGQTNRPFSSRFMNMQAP